MNETNLNENEEIAIAKLSTMTQDAMVYKVSACFFFTRARKRAG